MKILSIQVGRVQSLGVEGAPEAHDKPWTTAFFKQPITGSIHVTTEGLSGDEVADRKNHGGIDKAVLIYSADHSTAWADELPDLDCSPGAFGENLTISGADESTVCLGDVWEAGAVRLEVSQPRQPCWKLGRRHRQADLPKRVVKTGRSGWYVRVLREGPLSADTDLALASRPHPDWPLTRVAEVFYDKKADPALRTALADLPQLADVWRTVLTPRSTS